MAMCSSRFVANAHANGMLRRQRRYSLEAETVGTGAPLRRIARNAVMAVPIAVPATNANA